MKKLLLSSVLLSMITIVSGCATTAYTTGAATAGFAKGFMIDVENTWQAIDKADKWFQENYW